MGANPSPCEPGPLCVFDMFKVEEEKRAGGEGRRGGDVKILSIPFRKANSSWISPSLQKLFFTDVGVVDTEAVPIWAEAVESTL